MYNIQDVKLSITSAPRWLWHKLSKTSLKAIQLQYQILWSTPLQNILFPKIMGSRGVLIPPRRNRVETGFAAMTTPHNSHKLWHNFILCDSSYWADSDCQDHTNCPHTIQGILWGFSTLWVFWPTLSYLVSEKHINHDVIFYGVTFVLDCVNMWGWRTSGGKTPGNPS